MRTKGLLHVFLFCLINPSIVHAAEGRAIGSGNTNAPVANLRLFTDKSPAGKIDRALLQYGDDQFSFVTPEGFRGNFDSSTRIVRLVSTGLQATMFIAVLAARPESDLEVSPASLSARVLSDYPGAQVVDQFEVSVGNWRGPAVEVEWPSGSGKKTLVRVAHVPFPNGVLSFTVQAPANQMRACDHSFNQLLLSFRGGLNGRAATFQQFLPEL